MKNFSGVCQAAGADKPLRAFFIWITNIVTLLTHHSFSLFRRKTINTVWMIEMITERAVKTRVWFHGKWSTNEASNQTIMLATRNVNIPLSSFFCPVESFIIQISIYRPLRYEFLLIWPRADKKRIPVLESTICTCIQTRADFFFRIKMGHFLGH